MLGLALLTLSASAHRPTVCEGQYSARAGAYLVEDPAISIVVYHYADCETPQLWMQLEGQAGQELYLELGMPVLDRLEDRRPALALVGPGLPAPDIALPFALEPGEGAIVYDSAGMEAPPTFYEPFSQTESWILAVEEPVLPEDGSYHLVAWFPDARSGRLWVAVGLIEDFSDVDWGELGQTVTEVRVFHEEEDAPDGPVEEESCVDEQPAASGACSSVGGAPRAWSLAGLALFGLRRRR